MEQNERALAALELVTKDITELLVQGAGREAAQRVPEQCDWLRGIDMNSLRWEQENRLRRVAAAVVEQQKMFENANAVVERLTKMMFRESQFSLLV